MGRKTTTYIAPNDGSRDAGKHYLITEWPASRAEEWAYQAFLVITRSGVEVAPEIMQAGIVGLVILGMRAFSKASWDEMRPLMREMMTCVQAMPNPSKPQTVRELVETDIEEVKTRFFLRREVLELHAGFTFADAASMLQAAAARSFPDQNSNTTQMSPGSSDQ